MAMEDFQGEKKGQIVLDSLDLIQFQLEAKKRPLEAEGGHCADLNCCS